MSDRDKNARWRRLQQTQVLALIPPVTFSAFYFDSKNELFMVAGIAVFVAIGLYSWFEFFRR